MSRKKIILPLLILGLVMLSYRVACIGWADIKAWYIHRQLVNWGEDNRQLDAEYVNSWLQVAMDGLALTSNNDALWLDLGRLYEWRAVMEEDSVDKRQFYRRQALKSYRLAHQINPASPYIWAQIAVVKHRLLEWDNEYQQAIQYAARLGPWEPEVQAAVTKAGLGGWQSLSAQGQAIVLENSRRGLSWHLQQENMIQQMLWAGHQPLLEKLVADDEVLKVKMLAVIKQMTVD